MVKKTLIMPLFIMLFILAGTNLTTAQQGDAVEKEFSRVVLETTQGNIEIKFFPQQAPKAVENFMRLVKRGYYDGTLFHRVIKGFMIQGGDPTGTGRGGDSMWGGAFKDEISPDLTFDRKGLLAMANAGPNSNRSQFFITTAATPWLNKKHTIFGEVVSGYDTVQKIEITYTGAGDRPLEDQKVIKAYVTGEEEL